MGASEVAFAVTFSEAVAGVDSSDFAIDASGLSGTSAPVVTGSGSSYTVTVGTGSGDGTLGLNLLNNGSIHDLAGNLWSGGSAKSDPYTIDKTAPVVVSSVRAGPNPTNASAVVFTVTFSEAVSGVDPADFALAATGLTAPTVSSVVGGGRIYAVTATTAGGDGTIQLRVIDNNSILDAAGNMLGGPGDHDGDFLSGQTYTIDRSYPTDVSLSNARVSENVAAGTPVGVFISTAPLPGFYSYALISGSGDSDNASFTIVGDLLKTNAVFNFATKSTYSIRVRTTDSSGYSFDKVCTISIVPEADTVAIGDLVWNDRNANGLQDAGEPGVGGVVVELYCSPTGVVGGVDDYSLGQVTTDSSGHYRFDHLLPHTADAPDLLYYLVFRTPAGYTFTTANVGTDDTVDSDAGTTGVTGVFNLANFPSVAQRNSFDAGLIGAPSYDFSLGAGSTGDDSGAAVATDSMGNVYVAGTFYGTVDFDPGPGVCNLTSAGGSDVFIAKYSSDGALFWARRGGGSTNDSAAGIALGPDGSIYVSGDFAGTADFPSDVADVDLTSAGARDGFVLKLTPNGSVVWARGMGGSGDDVASSVAVASDGTVYATGRFEGNANFGAQPLSAVGPIDAFVAKLDASGNGLWAERMGGINSAQGNTIGTGIATAPDGSVYVTGSFHGIASFGASTLTAAPLLPPLPRERPTMRSDKATPPPQAPTTLSSSAASPPRWSAVWRSAKPPIGPAVSWNPTPR